MEVLRFNTKPITEVTTTPPAPQTKQDHNTDCMYMASDGLRFIME